MKSQPQPSSVAPHYIACLFPFLHSSMITIVDKIRYGATRTVPECATHTTSTMCVLYVLCVAIGSLCRGYFAQGYPNLLSYQDMSIAYRCANCKSTVPEFAMKVTANLLDFF